MALCLGLPGERQGLDDIISVLQQNRLWLYGHVLWKENNDWVEKCMEYEVEIDQRKLGERLWKKTVRHRNLTETMTWIIKDGNICAVCKTKCNWMNGFCGTVCDNQKCDANYSTDRVQSLVACRHLLEDRQAAQTTTLASISITISQMLNSEGLIPHIPTAHLNIQHSQTLHHLRHTNSVYGIMTNAAKLWYAEKNSASISEFSHGICHAVINTTLCDN